METCTKPSLPSAARMKFGLARKLRFAQVALLVALNGVGGGQAQTLLRSAAIVDDAAAGQPTPAAGEVLYLFQRMALEPWARSAGIIAIDFNPGSWRVGSPSGPAATEAQLKLVFGNLKPVIVSGRCTDAAMGAPQRPCAFTLGSPDFAGIVNPERQGEVFGWVATAPATKLSADDTASTAMRYFGLLSPMRYASYPASRPGSGAIVALRYREAASTHMPGGFDHSAASLVVHNDRLPPITLRTLAGYEALARRIAGL